jgi:hypothetical protein
MIKSFPACISRQAVLALSTQERYSYVKREIWYTWEKTERHMRCWREYLVHVGEKRKA